MSGIKMNEPNENEINENIEQNVEETSQDKSEEKAKSAEKKGEKKGKRKAEKKNTAKDAAKDTQTKETAKEKKSAKPKSEKQKSVSKKTGKKKKEYPILVIVESPAKTKSIGKFLGTRYRIESSKGHLIDLPKSSLGIDIENSFEPRYITIRGKGKTLAELKKAAKSSSEVLLATDPDREGEAISWHLARALGEVNSKIKRIEFNEITKDAVVDAVAHPREIDLLRVNSQQARRLLDRLVGYSISPVLQDKFGSKRFSAGRVQSVALRILCQREDEIDKFTPKEYWEMEAAWEKEGSKKKDKETFFNLAQIDGEKISISNAQQAESIEKEIRSSEFLVSKRKKSERRSKPQAPYITSRLQQDSSTRLGFRAQKTMSVAQSLYEGVELADGNQVGLITYMRTDSTRISETGLKMARDYIQENFEQEYLPEKPNIYGGAKQAQDAHEAIRPTDVSRTPDSIAAFLTRDQQRLYNLIWSRFVASQMSPGVDELVSLEIRSNDKRFLFRFSSSAQKFPGFRAVYSSGSEKAGYIPNFQENDSVNLHQLNKTQKFTQPPPRFTEASLIKIMEESGIGRPATYVPTIGTLDKRAYLERKGKQLRPTTLGRVVNEMLVKHFPDIVDIKFTAGMEEKLDEIGQGNIDWRNMLGDFFTPFKEDVQRASENMEDQSHLVRIPIGRNCPKCNQPLMKKLGRNGYFIGCSNFIGGCLYTESIPLGVCPLCGGNVVKKASRKGRPFYGCENYSTTGCEFVMMDVPSARKCPRCGSIMGQKVRKSGITLTCQNPDCRFTMQETTEDEQKATT